MKVILQQNVSKLGQIGDVVKVKDGFARNFLFPKKIAVEASAANVKIVQAQKQSKMAVLEKEKNEAQEFAKKLENISFTLAVEANAEDKLYGGVGAYELAGFLESEGYNIDKKNILLDEPIKALGIYQVDVRLYPDVVTKIKIWIVRK